jgi:hypothetical protein
MKVLGFLLLLIGAVALLIGLNIDTTVSSGLAGGRVHNIGLMNEKQNTIILASALAIVGAVFFGFASRSGAATVASADGRRQCPHCAEYVKPEAKVCRYCQRDLPSLADLAALEEESRRQVAALSQMDAEAARLAEEKMPKGTCPNCDRTIPLASLTCRHCNADFGPGSAWSVRASGAA